MDLTNPIQTPTAIERSWRGFKREGALTGLAQYYRFYVALKTIRLPSYWTVRGMGGFDLLGPSASLPAWPAKQSTTASYLWSS